MADDNKQTDKEVVIPELEGKSDPNPETEQALDQLLADSIAEEAVKTETEEEVEAPVETEVEAKVETEVEDKPVTEDKPGEAKTEDNDKPVEIEDSLDQVKLPPHTKPATTLAFAKVKEVARVRISEVEKENSDLKARLEEASKAPETDKKELEELRAFRASMDVEADPVFKDFDAKVGDNFQSIFSKLKGAGILDDKAVKRVEELGGPANVEWDALLEKFSDKIPVGIKRFVEGKLFENESLLENKAKAIETAKKRSTEFVAERRQQIETSSVERQKKTVEELNTMLPQMPWMAPKKIDAKMKPEEKASAEAHNKLIEDVKKDMDEIINDDSPTMRALSAITFATLKKTRAELAEEKASRATEVSGLKKQLTEATALIEKIKNSSTTRLRNTPALKGEQRKGEESYISMSPSDALDRRLREAQAAAE